MNPSLILNAQVVHRVHAELTIDATIRLGREIGVLFGSSGAGKSTLLRLIAGLSRPDSGSVTLAGQCLLDASAGIDVPLRRRRISMIFQNDLLFPHLNVAANVGFGLRGASRIERGRRVEEVAALCGVGALLHRRVATLSGGERQRVGLARALAPRPSLLLCDEPVSALDLSGRRSLLDRLASVQTAEAIPILYVTHSPSEAVMLGTRLFLMEAGRIIAEGSPADVLADARRIEFHHLEGLRNAFTGTIVAHADDRGWTRVQVDDGPSLIVAFLESPIGTKVDVEVDGDDVILARSPVVGLSARNQISGFVERIAVHGPEAEAVIRVGAGEWLVSILAATSEELGLSPGVPVVLIIKARSVRVVTRV